jgi:hypothetical protein
MLTEQDRQFGIHFPRNRGTGITAAAPATAAPATAYGFDYQIGRFAFLRRHDRFRSRRAALHGLELISCLHFVP